MLHDPSHYEPPAPGAPINKGTPDIVRQRTHEVLGIMAPGGGYIAGASHDYILEETPVENVVAMYDTIAEWRPI